MTPRRRRSDETTEEYSAAMQKFKELEQRYYGGGSRPSSSGGFFRNLFSNRDQGSGSGLQTLLGSSALTQARGYDEDHERKWRERFGTGQERTNLDAPQTGLSAAQINLRPGLKGNRVTPGMFGPAFDFMTGKVSQKTNNPAEVAGLGNVVSDPDGSMYGTDSSPALADYMAPQEDMTSTLNWSTELQEKYPWIKESQGTYGSFANTWIGENRPPRPFSLEEQNSIETMLERFKADKEANEQRAAYGEEHDVPFRDYMGFPSLENVFGIPISDFKEMSQAEREATAADFDFRAGKLNENISGNIYAKHGGSVFRNAYDQASRIMSGGLEGLKESIDINGQPHNLAYINPSEANLLEVLGGSGQKVNGVPAYYFGNGDFGAAWGDGDDDDDGGNGVKGGRGSPEHAEQPGERAAHAAAEGRKGQYSDPSQTHDPYGFWVKDGPNPPHDPAGLYGTDRTDQNVKIKSFKHGQYFDGKNSQMLGLKATDEEIAAALRSDQLNWWHAVGSPAAKGKSDKQIQGIADKYGQEYDEKGYHAARYVLSTGLTEGELNTIKNTAKEAGEKGRAAAIDAQTKSYGKIDWAMAGPPEYDIFGNIKQPTEVWDLEAYLELNEDLTQKAEDEAVISSMLGQEGVENFIPYDPGKGVLQLGPGVMETVWDIVTGKTFNIEEAPQAILSTIMSKAGWGFIDAAAWVSNFIGNIMGEQVIGTVEVNGITMNLHESGKLTFASPEDDPGYDASGEGEGGDTSGLKAVKRERLPIEEEEEDKSTRSIADLVKKSSPGTGTGTDSLLEFYQSIYGPDVNPFNVST